MEERKKKGMCFHCDDKWVVGHQCKSPKFFLLEGLQQQRTRSSEEVPEVETPEEDCSQLEIQQEVVKSTADITLYALSGSPSPGTMSVR